MTFPNDDRCPVCDKHMGFISGQDMKAEYPQDSKYFQDRELLYYCLDCGLVLPREDLGVRPSSYPIDRAGYARMKNSFRKRTARHQCRCDDCKKTLEECSLRDFPWHDGYGQDKNKRNVKK